MKVNNLIYQAYATIKSAMRQNHNYIVIVIVSNMRKYPMILVLIPIKHCMIRLQVKYWNKFFNRSLRYR